MFANRRTGNKSVKIFSKAFKVLENKLPKRILKTRVEKMIEIFLKFFVNEILNTIGILFLFIVFLITLTLFGYLIEIPFSYILHTINLWRG